jgi:hypothetical protein
VNSSGRAADPGALPVLGDPVRDQHGRHLPEPEERDHPRMAIELMPRREPELRRFSSFSTIWPARFFSSF